MLKIFISSDLNGKTLDCLLLTDDGSREGEIVDVITLEELFYSKNEL